MICIEVRGEVASSSIVPCRFSSAKRRMVSMGVMNSATTAMLCRTPEMTQSLRLSLGPPPISDMPGPHRHQHEAVDHDEVEGAEEQRPDAEGHVGDGAAEVVAPLLLDEGPDVAQRGHERTSSAAGASSPAGGAAARRRRRRWW